MSEEVEHHGDSPAAWTAVVVMLIGVAAATLGFYLAEDLVLWGGVALVPVGLLLGWILAKLGYGIKGPKYTPKHKD